ncbi:MAG: ATPase [Alphaproteobacteria bacterium]|nr:ATPase [Alphaproteobacteria bacterium]
MQSPVPPKPSPRREKHFHEARNDPYQARVKLADPTVCPGCNAVHTAGRWHWGDRPDNARPHLCPACQRIKDKVPAGIVLLRGEDLATHRDELLNLARHQEALEKSDHPLNRILAIVKRPDEIEITTTDIHLPRRIGDALHHAHKGELDLTYADEEYFLRVSWTR